ncbi:MAG: glutamine amidotransferase [Planctomycetota bacterium]
MLSYLVLNPPNWPVLLPTVAAAGLAWEIVSLTGSFIRRTDWPRGLALTAAALLVGPLAVVASIVRVAMHASAGDQERRETFIPHFLRGSAIAVLAVVVWKFGASGGVCAIGAVAMLWSVRAYSRTTAPLKRRSKILLLTLRIAVILLLTLWALGPADESVREVEIRGVALVGIDTSASMARKDMPLDYRSDTVPEDVPPLERMESLRQAISEQWNRIAALADQVDLELFLFDSSAGSVQNLLPDGRDVIRFAQPDGPATALGDATNRALEQFAASRRDVVAVMLFTDGCNNTTDILTPIKLAEIKGSQGLPIFTVGVGWDRVTGSTHTLSVRDLSAPEEVEVFNRLPITATIEAVGLPESQAKVTCRVGEEVVGTEMVSISTKNETIPVRFMHVPLAAGFQRVKVSVELQGKPPRGLAGQMSDDRLVRVTNRQMRILYIEHTFRVEKKFVYRALQAAPRIRVVALTLIRPFGDDQPIEMPGETMDEWMRFHAIILGDVPASAFSRKQLDILRDLVSEKGKGLMMLGGNHTFGQGGWADTPLAAALPVDLKKSRGHIETPIRMVPTKAGRAEDFMRIGAEGESVAEAWEKMTPLPGANRLGGVKLGATVLGETADGSPLLVTQPYGAGRSIAVGLDSTWRWVLTPNEVTPEMQKRFWRQLAIHLCSPRGNIWIATDKTTYDLRRIESGSESIEVTAGVEDPTGKPLLAARPEVILTGPDQSRSQLKLAPGDENLFGRIPLPRVRQAGSYKLEIRHTMDGKPLESTHRFEVIKKDLEALQALANFDLLKQMARESSGQFVPLRDLGELMDDLSLATQPRSERRIARTDLAGEYRWPLLIALAVLLCAEWMLRKRKGLV